MNEINTFVNDLTRYENLSFIHLNIRSLKSNLDEFHTLLEESKHPFSVICLNETLLMTVSLKQIQIITYQIMKEFFIKEKLTKEGVGYLCILGTTSPIKFETICVFLMAREKFSQVNYSQKA